MPKRIVSFVIAATFAVIGSSSAVFSATSFSDVDKEHPAYSAVARAFEAGFFIDGADDGMFYPDNFINKFDTARTLARVAGISSDAADKAYGEYADLLSYYANVYKRWDTDADKEIAYLISEKILGASDLRSFVGIRPNGAEGLRALTKEEAAVFFVKAFNKTDEAAAAPVDAILADDRLIAAAARPYVYYIKSLGIPLFDENNAFSPRSAILKSELAVLISGLMGYVEDLKNPSVRPTEKTAAQEDSAPAQDSKEIKEPDKPTSAAAESDLKKTGRLVQIRITKEGTYITIADGNIRTEYRVLTERVDVFALPIDSYVIIYLDSYKAELVCGIEPLTDIEAKG